MTNNDSNLKQYTYEAYIIYKFKHTHQYDNTNTIYYTFNIIMN